MPKHSLRRGPLYLHAFYLSSGGPSGLGVVYLVSFFFYWDSLSILGCFFCKPYKVILGMLTNYHPSFRYVTTLRGHVSDVYMLSWSSDSRLLLSCSKDTTLKVWNMKTKKIAFDLPGHMDEVWLCCPFQI